MKKIDFALHVMRWASKQDKNGISNALCLMALTDGNLMTEDVYLKVKSLTRFQVKEAIERLHSAKYIVAENRGLVRIGSPQSVNKITQKGEEIVVKIINPQ